jgi:predicted DNA-binding WGR domain protein
MNQSKLKYARERLNAIYKTITAQLIPDYSELLEESDVILKIQNGELSFPWDKMDPDGWCLHRSFSNVLDSLAAPYNSEREKENKKLRDDYNRLIEKINRQKIAVEDELVLGSESKALALLEEFANTDFSE